MVDGLLIALVCLAVPATAYALRGMWLPVLQGVWPRTSPQSAAPEIQAEKPKRKRDRLGRFVEHSKESIETLGAIGEALELHDQATEKAKEVRKKFSGGSP